MSTLTREQVLAMTAGLELDAAVQRHFFTWPVERFPSYSTDIAAAWEVLDRLTADGRHDIEMSYLWPCEARASCCVNGVDGRIADADAPDMPLAICRVALLLTLTEAE